MNLSLFYLLSGIILISALLVVTLRNVFHSALMLVVAFFMVAGIYLMLNAEFLAAVQVLIYVGAITILIIFAIMLTYQIQSKSIRQTNEQVWPAAIISAILLALSIFAVTKSFNTFTTPNPNKGVWSASIDVADLPSADSQWSWTVDLEDTLNQNYLASGSFDVYPKDPNNYMSLPARNDEGIASGYIISSKSDYSTMDTLFIYGQSINLKVWSDGVNYGAIRSAKWVISSVNNQNVLVTRKLSNSNVEIIGRLLMSKFVLPFEVVSVLLLAAMIGAIVISKKDK